MKKRKQWIAMLLMLAMIFTALPMTVFAEGEPATQEDQGNGWTGEWDDMQVNVHFGLGNDNIGEEIYNSPRWNNAEKKLTPDELNALKDFYDNLLADATFEYEEAKGNWVKFTPTGWKINKYAPHLRSIEVPKGKKVRMKVPTSKLPKNFSLGEFQDWGSRAYIADTSLNPYDEASYINLYAIKYKVKFDAGEGEFPGGGKTQESYISRDGAITYPDKPTREGYLFKDWIVPIYYTKDLSLGGGHNTNISIDPNKKEGMSERVAVLEHGKTNDEYLWTYNHFYWVYERDKAKSEGLPS